MKGPSPTHLLFLLFLFTIYSKSDGYKILAFYGFSSHSHLNAFIPVVNELAERGHDVTMLQPYKKLKVHPKIKMLHSMDVEELKDEDSKHIFDENSEVTKMMGFVFGFSAIIEEACREVLKSDSVQSLLKQGKQFDIVIVNYILCECGFAIAPLLGNYTIYYSAGFIPHFFPSPAPVPYSTIPNHMGPLAPQMTFVQRLANVLYFLATEKGYHYYSVPQSEKIVKELVPEAPSIQEGMNSISLYITNMDPVIALPRPSVPNIVSLCCPHCREAKSLPQDMENFVASSGDEGFIMFGLGSHAQSRYFPQETKENFLKAFERLKQKVIWKFEDETLKPPPNVFLTKWMPQQDLLGHPKLRLFITHGGLLSLQEAVYNGVPVIGIPLFADQPGNVGYMVHKGLAGILHVHNITSEGVYQEIMKILNNPNYSEKMKKQSVLFREHNKGTVATGANWIEYVARHEGAWHLRTPGQDTCLFQYFLLDIILVVSAVATTIIAVSATAFRYLFRKFVCKKACKKKVKKS